MLENFVKSGLTHCVSSVYFLHMKYYALLTLCSGRILPTLIEITLICVFHVYVLFLFFFKETEEEQMTKPPLLICFLKAPSC